jgi:hypothetical protein
MSLFIRLTSSIANEFSSCGADSVREADVASHLLKLYQSN